MIIHHLNRLRKFVTFPFAFLLIASATESTKSIFERPLSDVIDHPELAEYLDPYLLKCETDDPSLYAEPLGTMSSCDRARFVADIRRLQQKVQSPNLAQTYGDDSIKPTEMEIRSDHDLPFADFFAEFEVKRKPVLITEFPNLIENSTAISFLFSCYQDLVSMKEETPYIDSFNDLEGTCLDKENDCASPSDPNELHGPNQTNHSFFRSSSFSSLDLCPEFSPSSNLKVPKYVMNDYLQRRVDNTSLSKYNYSDDSLQAVFIHSSERILPTDATCPSSLHGLYCIVDTAIVSDGSESASKSTHEPRIKSRVFSPTTAATALKPFITVHEHPVPHYLKQHAEDAWQVDPEKGFFEADFGSNSALFVPSGFVVTFQGEEKMTDRDGAVMLRFCFVDASNFNEVKESLRIDAMFDSLSKDLLLQLSNPNFDVKMHRDVRATSNWTEGYKAWPRDASSNDIDDDDKSSSQGNRRLNRARRRMLYSGWQVGKAWNHKVTSLTLPTLSPPEILNFGRQNVTLSWICPFQIKEGDASKVGYIISWEGFFANGTSLQQGNFTFDDASVSSPNLQMDYAADSRSRSFRFPVRKFKGIVQGLTSDSYYTFKVAMMYGNGDLISHAPFSPPSKTVKTAKPSKPYPLSSPPFVIEHHEWISKLIKDEKSSSKLKATMIVLEMLAPYDDGGHEILGYDVMRAHIDANGHNFGDWVLMTYNVEELTNENKPGGLVRLGIHNLLPGGSYLFKVAARNILGRSEWSSSSDEVSTVFSRQKPDTEKFVPTGLLPKGGHQLQGIGSHPISSPKGYRPLGELIKLNDYDQTIHCGGKTVHIWTSFWSPRGFLVEAEAYIVESGDTGDILENLEYRIAVIQRGGEIPIAKRALAAQRAGAVAVIVMDDGRCTDYDQYCMLGSNKMTGDLWGEFDFAGEWEDLRIPVVLVSITQPDFEEIFFEPIERTMRMRLKE